MSIVLVVVFGASALAFLGCFFLGLYRELRRRPQWEYVVEVIGELERKKRVISFAHKRRSA